VTARIHPGSIIHVWDHLVIGLRDAGGITCHLSLYAVTWSSQLGGGHVCLIDRRDERRVVLADPVDLGPRMRERLQSLGAPGSVDVVPVEAAAFERHPATAATLAWTIRGKRTTVEARWEALEPPVWVEGPAPAFWDREDIWACFVPAARATVTIDGIPAAGEPYDDDVWLPKLGRSLSSAHAALAEVRVMPVPAPPRRAGG
jgi:hypothetical protein